MGGRIEKVISSACSDIVTENTKSDGNGSEIDFAREKKQRMKEIQPEKEAIKKGRRK